MDFVAHLKQSGAPAEVIAAAEEAQKGSLMQADYTKKMQGLAEKEKQLAFYAGQMQTQQQAEQGAKASSPLTSYLDQLSDGEEGKVLRDLIGPGFEAVLSEVDSRYGQENAQLKRAVVVMNKMEEVRQRLESDLVGQYGDGIRPALKKVEARMRDELLQSREIHPEQALWAVAPEEARAALAQQKHDAETQRGRDTLGGFETMRRQSPPMESMPGQPGGTVSSVPAGDAPVPNDSLDFEALYDEIASEVRSAGV